MGTQQKFVPESQISEVERFKDSIKTIKEMFGRDKMKVVFFGRYDAFRRLAVCGAG